jgi:hypothetical protein
MAYVAAAMVMAGCASDDMIGDNNATQSDNQVIGFNMNMPAVTRAAEANAGYAKTLGYEFIVWGEKGEADAATTLENNTNIVFENYRVQYKDNDGSTKNSTVSNTTGWDYVGIAPYAEASANSPTKVVPTIYKDDDIKQTIKYWDFGGSTYTFTAVSALSTDIDGNKVTIRKNFDGASKTAHGYTITLTKGAKAENIFVSDRKEITPTIPATGGTMAAVQMAFRNFQTKIRFGFYETVPGYHVQITGVKYGSNSSAVKTLGVNGNFFKNPESASDKITYTVTYESASDGAKPVLTIANEGSTTKGFEEFGDNIFQTGENYLGTSSLDAQVTYNNSDKSYKCILPNTGNTTPMTFTVSYKLISEDTGEEIQIDDRQVTVPAAYCMWKPNFAYTYLFKVSDQSAELYPITFDAVVEADEVSKQETITEVASDETNKVCITTIGFDSNNTVVTSTTANEYASGNTIYASVMEGSNTTATTLNTTNIALYTVTGTQTITEASVANCVKNGTTPTSSAGSTAKTVTDLNGNTMTATPVDINTDGSTIPCIVATVPREDGNGNRDISALKWTGVANTTYAVEYTKTTTTTPAGESQSVTKTYKYYKIVVVK